VGAVIGLVLPFAVGIALSPIPTAAVILLVLSLHPGIGGAVFVAGWASGLLVVSVVLLLVLGFLGLGGTSAPGWVVPLRILLGVLLLLFAWERAGARRPAAMDPGSRSWVAGLDRLPPDRAFAMGALQAALDPRKLAVLAAVALAVGGAHLSTVDTVIVLLVFVVIASVGLAAPLVWSRLGGARARSNLELARARLVDDNGTIQAVTLLLLGTLLVGQGLSL
jgi:Sap, sulfolipid-1-addressing protein